MSVLPTSHPRVQTLVELHAQSDCDRCGVLTAQLADRERQIEHMADDIALFESKFRQAARAEQKAKRDLLEAMEEDPTSEQVKAVCEHWKTVMGHPKAKTPMNGKRASAVRARLRNRFTVAQLCEAVDGCRRSPWHMGQNPERKVYDDLEMICRDEVNVEKFIQFAAAPVEAVRAAAPRDGIGVVRMLEVLRLVLPDVPDSERQERLAEALDATRGEEPAPPANEPRSPELVQRVKGLGEHHFQPDYDHPSDPFESFLAEVERHGLRVNRNHGALSAMCQCPAHADSGPSLSVKWAGDRVLAHCFAGCEVAEICASLDWPLRWLFVPESTRRAA